VSKDAGTFADCTNEATEIATSSGIYYLDLTSTEMNADTVAVLVKTTSTGAVPQVFVLYPQESGDIKVDVQSYGGTAGTFSGGRPEVNSTHFAGTAYATALAAEVDAVWDEQVDGTVTGRQSMRLHNAALGGQASGLATTTALYKNQDGTKTRITATVDADGNRTTVTYTDLT
jgi:hypothetical protein